jgi:hypothetical protein
MFKGTWTLRVRSLFASPGFAPRFIRPTIILSQESLTMQIDLAAEMAAARQRRAQQTAQALRDARVVAVRAAARPGATREDIEDLARSFYPRLSDEQRAELTREVWEHPRGSVVEDDPRTLVDG